MPHYDGDVAVIGVGSVGSMALWRLRKQGIRADGFERFAPGHDRSAHGGESRIFRLAYFEDPRYVPLLKRAAALWRELESDNEGRHALLTQVGALMLGSPQSPGMRNALDSVSQYGLPATPLDRQEIEEQFPQHRLHPGDVGILDHKAGYIRPELAVWTAAKLATRLGATIRPYTSIEVIEPDADGVVIRSREHATFWRYRRAILSPGPFASPLLESLCPELAKALEIRRPVQAWFLPLDPDLYSSPRCPVFMRTSESGYNYYGFPDIGSGVKIGLNMAANAIVPEPENLERAVQVCELQPFHDLVDDCLRYLSRDPVRLGAYMEGYTEDHHGILGYLPGSERVVIAAGFSGHGFKLAPTFGDVCSRLVQNETGAGVEFLNPERFIAPKEATGA